MLGDFNAADTDWRSGCLTPAAGRFPDELLEVVNELALDQHKHKHTWRQTKRKSIRTPIFSPWCSDVSKADIVVPMGTINHISPCSKLETRYCNSSRNYHVYGTFYRFLLIRWEGRLLTSRGMVTTVTLVVHGQFTTGSAVSVFNVCRWSETLAKIRYPDHRRHLKKDMGSRACLWKTRRLSANYQKCTHVRVDAQVICATYSYSFQGFLLWPLGAKLDQEATVSSSLKTRAYTDNPVVVHPLQASGYHPCVTAAVVWTVGAFPCRVTEITAATHLVVGLRGLSYQDRL